jgi:hypothetical protein
VRFRALARASAPLGNATTRAKDDFDVACAGDVADWVVQLAQSRLRRLRWALDPIFMQNAGVPDCFQCPRIPGRDLIGDVRDEPANGR